MLKISSVLIIISSWVAFCLASNVAILQWDPNNPDPTGYSVFMRTSGQVYDYDNPIKTEEYPDGLITHPMSTVTIPSVPAGTYYFVCRAYQEKDDGTLFWSGDSNEVMWISDGTSPATIEIMQPKNIEYMGD